MNNKDLQWTTSYYGVRHLGGDSGELRWATVTEIGSTYDNSGKTLIPGEWYELHRNIKGHLFGSLNKPEYFTDMEATLKLGRKWVEEGSFS